MAVVRGLIVALLALLAALLLALLANMTRSVALPIIWPSATPLPATATRRGAPVFPPTWTHTPTHAPAATATAVPTLRARLATASPSPTTSRVPSLTPDPFKPYQVIGYSVENRPIGVYRFGRGPQERLIVAGIHGADEYNTVVLAEQMIAYLDEHPDLVPPQVSLFILPVLNPDSAAIGPKEKARHNANGVDLNRNFPVGWQSMWRARGCSSLPGTAGEGPASEPETLALMAFVLAQRIDVLVSYHSAALGIFPSGSPAHPDSVRLARAIADVSPYAYPPYRTGCEYTGTLVDWAASVGVRGAVDIELNTLNQSEFNENLAVIKLLLAWRWPDEGR